MSLELDNIILEGTKVDDDLDNYRGHHLEERP